MACVANMHSLYVGIAKNLSSNTAKEMKRQSALLKWSGFGERIIPSQSPVGTEENRLIDLKSNTPIDFLKAPTKFAWAQCNTRICFLSRLNILPPEDRLEHNPQYQQPMNTKNSPYCHVVRSSREMRRQSSQSMPVQTLSTSVPTANKHSSKST